MKISTSPFYLYPIFLAVSLCAISQTSPAAGFATGGSIAQLREQISMLQVRAPLTTGLDCEALLNGANKALEDWMPLASDESMIQKEGPALLQLFFDARLSLHQRIPAWPLECASKLKSLFRNMRATEDILGVVAYQDPQIRAGDISFSQQPVPIIESDKYRPYHSTLTSASAHDFQFKKGDLIISKGVSMTSSMISSIAIPASLFSHIVFVYQNSKDSAWGTIESYIGKGVDTYPLRKALLNENARLLVLRLKDQNLAIRAHDYILGRVQNARPQKIPYDYAQDFSDNSRLSCEEVAYDAVKYASQGAILLPENPSSVELKDDNFAQAIGLKNGPVMVPADLEVDSRFDIVMDWTDYRLARDSWRKDALAAEVVRWINEENYRMQNSYRAIWAKIIWGTRSVPWLWTIAADISGIPRDFSPDVPANAIATIANLETLASALLPRLERLDAEQYKKTKRWLSRAQLREQLDRLRVEDQARYRPPVTFSDFHYFFKPN